MDQMQQRSTAAGAPRHDLLGRILPVMSLVTMAMTVPQVWAVWVQGQTAGVSLLSWGAYFVSACLWMADGLRRRMPSIWIACIGWVLLDGAVVLGVLVR